MSLVIKDVSKIFKSKHKETKPLSEVNLTVNKGEFICLLGPSGCGKSTLLNIIAGLEQPSEGELLLNGEKITGVSKDRAMVFQEAALFPWLRVIDNVEFGMKIAGVPPKERREKAMKYLKMVHLAKFKDSFVHELSGGMRQRAAIARALTLDSEVLLMDEPFAALDSSTKNILQIELQKIWMETKKTIIFVTHNVEEAVLLADRVIVMGVNPGRVKRDIKIQIARPRTLENSDLGYVVADVMRELKEEVEKVAKAEFDSDWNIEETGVLSDTGNNMGGGL